MSITWQNELNHEWHSEEVDDMIDRADARSAPVNKRSIGSRLTCSIAAGVAMNGGSHEFRCTRRRQANRSANEQTARCQDEVAMPRMSLQDAQRASIHRALDL